MFGCCCCCWWNSTARSTRITLSWMSNTKWFGLSICISAENCRIRYQHFPHSDHSGFKNIRRDTYFRNVCTFSNVHYISFMSCTMSIPSSFYPTLPIRAYGQLAWPIKPQQIDNGSIVLFSDLFCCCCCNIRLQQCVTFHWVARKHTKICKNETKKKKIVRINAMVFFSEYIQLLQLQKIQCMCNVHVYAVHRSCIIHTHTQTYVLFTTYSAVCIYCTYHIWHYYAVCRKLCSTHMTGMWHAVYQYEHTA